MKCQVCNAEASNSASFCPQCGAKLQSFDFAESPSVNPAPQDSPAPTATSSGGRIRDVAEETLWEGTYSPKAMLGTLVLCGLASVALVIAAFLLATTVLSMVLVGAIFVIWLWAGWRLMTKRLGVSYKLTNHLFFHRHGVLHRVTDRIELIEIHDVTWSQGLFERLVDVGTITLTSADRTHPKFPMPGIDNIENVASLIDKARRSEQVRRGRRIDFSSIDGQT